MPPRPRPPRRTPRSVVYRRRLVALVVLIAGFAIAWAIVSSFGGSGKSKPPTTAPVARRPFKVVFPEGFTRAQMAQRVNAVAQIARRERGREPALSSRAYLADTRASRREPGFGRKRYPLEGFLFPATYDFVKGSTSRQLVQKQLSAFADNWSHVDLKYARSKHLTPYDVLIIASLVEKEALVPDERPKIARVIYNRLHARMNLGIDATTRYGLHVPGTKSLTQSELNSTNPYNTRNPNVVGLPPTPIANPGLAAMQAAAHPAPGDWLYFVRKPDHQHHYFTSSYNDFINHVHQYGY